jgi:hypothetical protein
MTCFIACSSCSEAVGRLARGSDVPHCAHPSAGTRRRKGRPTIWASLSPVATSSSRWHRESTHSSLQDSYQRVFSIFHQRLDAPWQRAGLVTFVASDLYRYYRLSLLFKELVVMTRRFHLKSLLPLLSSDERFMVWYVAAHPDRWCKGCGRRVMSLSE